MVINYLKEWLCAVVASCAVSGCIYNHVLAYSRCIAVEEEEEEDSLQKPLALEFGSVQNLVNYYNVIWEQ